MILDAQKGTSVQVYCSTFFDENDDSGAAKEFVAGFKEWLNADSQKLTNNGGNDIVQPSRPWLRCLHDRAGSHQGRRQHRRHRHQGCLFGVDYDGVTGSITFDQTTGDANKDMAYIKKADNRRFRVRQDPERGRLNKTSNSLSQRLTALPAPSMREPFCSFPAGLALWEGAVTGGD